MGLTLLIDCIAYLLSYVPLILFFIELLFAISFCFFLFVYFFVICLVLLCFYVWACFGQKNNPIIEINNSPPKTCHHLVRCQQCIGPAVEARARN